jgi:hypothetical protein
MTILSLLALAAVLQQPTTAKDRALQARRAALDSSRAAIAHMADRVADVRSALDVYRRAVFNGTDAEVLSMAAFLRNACHGMDSVAGPTVRKVCRRCAFQREVQAAFDGYRQAIPAVGRAGAGCVTRLTQLARRPAPAKGFRDEVRAIGNPIVSALMTYEQRLHAVLVALNAAPPG